MKKSVKATLLTSLLCSTLIGPTALAAGPAQAESAGKVTFTHEDNPLRVATATDIIFGEVAISGDTKTYNALYQDSDKFTEFGGTEKFAPLNVTTVDNRGDNAGWKLTVKMDDQFKTADGDVLSASLKLEPTSVATSKDEGASRGVPSVKGVATELTPGSGEAMMMNAKPNEGIGTWTTLFGDLQDDTQAGKRQNDKVQLKVFGGNNGQPTKENKEYSTTVTWTLLNTGD